MSRRKRKQAEHRNALIGLVLIFVCAWLLLRAIQSSPGAFGDFLLLLLLVAGAIVIVPRLLRRSRRRSLLNKADMAVAKQIEPLVRRRAQLVRPDPYGKVQVDKWENEIGYFITHHIAPSLTRKEQWLLPVARLQISKIINDRVETAMRDRPIFAALRKHESHGI